MQLREVHREEQRGDQLQHAGSGLANVAETTTANSLVLVDGKLVVIVAVGQYWRALAPRAVAPRRRHQRHGELAPRALTQRLLHG